MLSPLSIDDPLSNQAVTIIITLPASEQPREERPCLVSVGEAEKLPLSRTGLFANLTTLIDAAWTALGVREATAVRTDTTEFPQNESIDSDEEELAAVPATVAGLPPVPPAQPARPSTPVAQPKMQNLSLF
ncbi:MAG: hypothetical protein WAS33_16345 [Candidatus Promineifilaceae bacterium]